MNSEIRRKVFSSLSFELWIVGSFCVMRKQMKSNVWVLEFWGA